MDKLKPLIQHHFWIVFGLVLILPLAGWMPAASQFSQKTAEKISKIDEAFNKVPGGAQANKSWSTRLNEKAQMAEEKNLDARYGLWKRQEAMMVWPSTIRKDLQPKAYRDEISPIARNIYKNNYKIEVRNVWRKADPFNIETGKGTVLFDLEQMPRYEFGELTPKSNELWDAQEDLWLLESLLKSIRRANSDASLLTESLVRSIKVLELVGGPGDYPEAERPAGSSEYGDEGGEFEMFDDPDMMDGGAEGGRRGRMGSIGPQSVSFSPADEFGKEEGRYIDYKEGTVFKKRGFYLEAIIDHQRLPKLLAELSNNSWPVTITRVQMAQAGSEAASRSGGEMEMGMDFETEYESGGLMGGRGRSGPAMIQRPRPLGPSRPMPMPGGADEYGPEGSARGSEFASLAAAAQFGPQLAVVAISGVIHIYNPPENLEELRAKATAPKAAPTETLDVPADTPPGLDDLAPPETTPDQPDLPELLDSPETPDAPETPDSPETPETPDAPETPDDAPESPEPTPPAPPES